MPTRGDIARTYDEIAVEYDRARQVPWPEVVEFAESLPRRCLVADLGCGGGRNAKVLIEKGHRVVGLDASSRLLSIARGKLPAVPLLLGDLCNLPFRGAQFPAAISVAAIHHLPSELERLRAMREIGRVLRPGGRVLVTVWSLVHERQEGGREIRPAGPGPRDVWVPWRAGGREVLRFYHLFEDNELTHLILRAGLGVAKYFRRGDNYIAVAERHG